MNDTLLLSIYLEPLWHLEIISRIGQVNVINCHKQGGETMETNALWGAVMDRISQKIPRPSFETWFIPTTATIKHDKVFITAPNSFARDWLENRYQDLIAETVEEVSGKKYAIVITEEEETGEVRLQQRPKADVLDVPFNTKIEARTLLKRLLQEEIYADDLALRLLQMNHTELGYLKQCIQDEKTLQ